jgi:HK97 family phage prohead protease
MENIKIKKTKIDENFEVVLTREIEDRDGEIIVVDGIDTTNFEKNPVLLDSHDHTSTIERVIGRVKNLNKTKIDDVPALVGTIEFAPTDKGELAKTLVANKFVNSVSIGFGNTAWDGKRCIKCELFEVSLVAIPANVEAVIKTLKEEKLDLNKVLKHYKEIKTKIKNYRDVFMSNELWEKLGINKTGDELQDLIIIQNAINNLITSLSTSSNSDNVQTENQEVHSETENQVQEEIESEKIKLLKKLSYLLINK